jgi:histidine triad (HIT) family protein
VNEDCVFCQILAGNMPGEVVYEDEHAVGFMDIFPWTRGHAVVVPRKHSKNLYEIGADDLSHTMRAAQRLAEQMRSAATA